MVSVKLEKKETPAVTSGISFFQSFLSIHCNSSAFSFLLQASSHAKPLRGGLMHPYLYVISRTLQPVQSPELNCYHTFSSFVITTLSQIFTLISSFSNTSSPDFSSTGRSTLYSAATRIVDTTALTNVVAVLHLASTSAICCGCPRMYCL